MFQLMTGIVQFIRTDRVRAIAVAAPRRSTAAPEVPTAAEAGLPGLESSAWFGIMAPKGTPKAVIDRLNKDINAVVVDISFNKRLLEIGVEPMGGTVEQFVKYLDSEIRKWGEVVRVSGAKLD
jgi:tripartite-type tricarboxylate transporter receptor subunit TctC